jgi:hypothetical protein
MTATFFDGVHVIVEAALSASTGTYGAWDSGLWDTATWGPDVLWTDITAYVRTIKADRAFSRGVQAWSAGTAQLVLDNRDGRFSPDNLSGPYVTAGVTQVRPWRPVRIRATYSGTTYYLYTGYALDWVESWAGPARTGKGDAICTVPCTDELGHLAGFDGLAQTPAGAGETSGARIHRVLNNAGHTGTRSIDVGRTTVQDTKAARCGSTPTARWCSRTSTRCWRTPTRTRSRRPSVTAEGRNCRTPTRDPATPRTW